MTEIILEYNQIKIVDDEPVVVMEQPEDENVFDLHREETHSDTADLDMDPEHEQEQDTHSPVNVDKIDTDDDMLQSSEKDEEDPTQETDPKHENSNLPDAENEEERLILVDPHNLLETIREKARNNQHFHR